MLCTKWEIVKSRLHEDCLTGRKDLKNPWVDPGKFEPSAFVGTYLGHVVSALLIYMSEKFLEHTIWGFFELELVDTGWVQPRFILISWEVWVLVVEPLGNSGLAQGFVFLL